MDIKVVLAFIGIVIGIISFLPYLYHIFKDKTKPHVFSWFIWGTLTATAFFAQFLNGGGIGAWVTLVSSIFCYSIFIIASYRFGIDYVTKLDWICLLAAMLGILTWYITNNPLTAVIIAVITDGIGFVPSYRKAYHRPSEETVSTYFLNAISFVFGIIALQTFTLTTLLYPVYIVIADFTFMLMVLVRRFRYGSK